MRFPRTATIYNVLKNSTCFWDLIWLHLTWHSLNVFNFVREVLLNGILVIVCFICLLFVCLFACQWSCPAEYNLVGEEKHACRQQIIFPDYEIKFVLFSCQVCFLGQLGVKCK